MPYGIPKNIGGDSPENVKWMEGCVNKVMKTGRPKPSAIAICKTQLTRNKSKSSDDSSVDEDILSGFEMDKNNYIRKLMEILDVPFNVASELFEYKLLQNNYDLLKAQENINK